MNTLLKYLLPGGYLLLRGRKFRGLLTAGIFLCAAGVLLGRWSEVVEVLHGGAQTGAWIATGYLLFLLAVSWWLNVLFLRERDGTGDSPWQAGFRRFARDRLALAGLIVLFAAYSIAILAPFLAPHDPIAQRNVMELRLLAPSLESGYPLGTDVFGRDVFTRIIFGARVSLFIGFVAVGIAVVMGTFLGLIAGYSGGWIDSALMRFVDLMLGFPRLFLILIIIAFTGPSILWTMLVLGLTGWMGLARIVRGETLSLKSREYIQAARALGINTPVILFRHILPNILPPIVVFATLSMGSVILIEAGLSFLGLGVQPPAPSWGNMVNLGRGYLLDAWWIATFPGLAIVGTVITFNLVGDGLQDALDPKSSVER